MDSVDVGRALLGRSQNAGGSGAVTQIGAVAASDSAAGRVEVWIEGEPVECACNVSVKAGQAVTVTVANRRPTVTGVAGWGDQVAVKIGEIAAEVAYIDQAYVQELVANSITAASIVAASLYVGTLEAGDVTADSINAAVAEIGKLDADEVNAAVADIGKLDAEVINAAIAKVDLLDAEAISAAVAKIGELDVEQLEAVVAKVGTLDAYLINAAVAKVGQLETGKLDADMANIDIANISTAYVKWLNAGYAHIAEGVIDNAKIRFADVQDVEIESAMIDVAEIRDMLVKSGIIGEFVSESGKITGVLDAVRINADAIKAGTLSVDRLMLRGENGLFYAVNASTDGVTAEQLATEEYRNAMHGDNIVASSITADKISVGDLVAFGATVGGLVIEDGCLRSFAKTSAASESAGFYLGADGSFSLGGRGHIKYDAATDSLDIRASNISVDASPLVVSAAEQFYQSSSPTSLSGGSWSPSQPAWAQGRYVWRRTRVDYSDGSFDFTPSDKGVCITGNTGADGATGPKGPVGATGPKGDKGDQGERGIQGIQGPKGDQGIQGPKGANGASTYFHIAYATNSTGTAGFSVSDSAGKTYIGTYVDGVAADSTDPSKYSWQLVKGSQGPTGAQGLAGKNGADGRTSYLHIAYATNSTGTAGFSVSDSAGKTYIGQYADFAQADSTDPSRYSWTLIKGATGPAGATGPKGPTGPTGATGPQGPAGAAGANGKMLYGASNTAAATAAKVTASNIAGFSLYVGSTVSIKFTYANTAVSPTLNVNGTGAKQIRLNGANSAYWGGRIDRPVRLRRHVLADVQHAAVRLDGHHRQPGGLPRVHRRRLRERDERRVAALGVPGQLREALRRHHDHRGGFRHHERGFEDDVPRRVVQLRPGGDRRVLRRGQLGGDAQDVERLQGARRVERRLLELDAHPFCGPPAVPVWGRFGARHVELAVHIGVREQPVRRRNPADRRRPLAVRHRRRVQRAVHQQVERLPGVRREGPLRQRQRRLGNHHAQRDRRELPLHGVLLQEARGRSLLDEL